MYDEKEAAEGAEGVAMEGLLRDGPAMGGMFVASGGFVRGGMRSAGVGPGEGTIWDVRRADELLWKRALMAWANAFCA